MMIQKGCCAPSLENVAQNLNDNCSCTTTSYQKLAQSFNTIMGEPDAFHDIQDSHPHLFSRTPVFIENQHFLAMKNTVKALEDTIHLSTYRDTIRAGASEISQQDFGPKGVLMGYDFHIDGDNVHLIEINTNAGGAFLVASLYDAQQMCCTEIMTHKSGVTFNHFTAQIVAMFQREWQLQGRTTPLKTIAIVDTLPQEQYLYPEFKIAQKMLEDSGIRVMIAAPEELTHTDNRLQIGTQIIDLVYNRLVDFDLSDPQNGPLHNAYLANDVVVTPNPHHHALFANKTNLAKLSSSDFLRAIDVPLATQKALTTIPPCQLVSEADPKQLWEDRRGLFFKPTSGNGGKAVYRGDKISKKTWQYILDNPYIAQKTIKPSQRTTRHNGDEITYKSDIRLYTYDGEVLLSAARLYQGQTTNFRTQGGGFSPVYII